MDQNRFQLLFMDVSLFFEVANEVFKLLCKHSNGSPDSFPLSVVDWLFLFVLDISFYVSESLDD